jgi:hypothetical protein
LVPLRAVDAGEPISGAPHPAPFSVALRGRLGVHASTPLGNPCRHRHDSGATVFGEVEPPWLCKPCWLPRLPLPAALPARAARPPCVPQGTAAPRASFASLETVPSRFQPPTSIATASRRPPTPSVLLPAASEDWHARQNPRNLIPFDPLPCPAETLPSPACLASEAFITFLALGKSATARLVRSSSTVNPPCVTLSPPMTRSNGVQRRRLS